MYIPTDLQALYIYIYSWSCTAQQHLRGYSIKHIYIPIYMYTCIIHMHMPAYVLSNYIQMVLVLDIYIYWYIYQYIYSETSLNRPTMTPTLNFSGRVKQNRDGATIAAEVEQLGPEVGGSTSWWFRQGAKMGLGSGLYSYNVYTAYIYESVSWKWDNQCELDVGVNRHYYSLALTEVLEIS